MFAKLSTLALLLPFVSALTINVPNGVTTGSTVTITWSASTTDPSSFSIELINTVFNNAYAIANNVPTAQGSITLQLPQVPIGNGYTLEAVATNNINTVYSSSGSFSIDAASSVSTTPASTTSGAIVTASSLSASAITPSVTATTPVSSVSSPASTASSSAAATPSSLTSGAASFKLIGVAPAAALVLSAVAGAAMVF